MCISSGLATFNGTTIYLGQRNHPVFGPIFVVGYENRVTNLSPGPNAMLLHFPAQEMSQKNFEGTSHSEHILADMREAIAPKPQALPVDFAPMGPVAAAAQAVEIFGRGIYTVVLARDARAIPSALEQIPVHKRIAPNQPLFDFYADHFPGYPIALCCFDNQEARDADPLLMWYRPLDPDHFVLPALDSHTGAVPDLNEEVEVDHWLILGSDEMPEHVGVPVRYSDRHMRTRVRLLLPSRVIGTHMQGKMRNGDFALRYQDVLRGDLSRIERVQPAPFNE